VLGNLAWVYFGQGQYFKDRYAKAEALYRRVLDLREAQFGPGHLYTADTLANLAEICAAQQNYKEAERLVGRALAIRQNVLGPKHPDTVASLKRYTFLMRKSKH